MFLQSVHGSMESENLDCTYMFESLVEKSKLRPPAKRDMNASPFLALPEPCLGTVLFNFIKSTEERRKVTDESALAKILIH